LKKINSQTPLKLFDVAQTRELEAAAAFHHSGGNTLMEDAGLAIAKLALAIKPFANCHWIFCGPGNNGGDGLEAVTHLHAWGQRVRVVLWQPPMTRPTDSVHALKKVRALDIAIQDHLPLLEDLSVNDLIIDALLGVGLRRNDTQKPTPRDKKISRVEDWIASIYQSGIQVLAVDIPSGLNVKTVHF